MMNRRLNTVMAVLMFLKKKTQDLKIEILFMGNEFLTLISAYSSIENSSGKTLLR